MRALVLGISLTQKKTMTKIKNSEFIHLHNHTEFSAFDGLNKMSNFPYLARKMGFKALGVTDHGTVGGLVKFFKSAQSLTIKTETRYNMIQLSLFLDASSI